MYLSIYPFSLFSFLSPDAFLLFLCFLQVGFVQMLLGILLKAMNALYFSQLVDFFFEALPQLFLFISLIGYMTFLILYKWITPVDEFHPKPSLINVLIDMNMGTGGGGGGSESSPVDSSLIMFDGQAEVQQARKDWFSFFLTPSVFLSCGV